MISSKYMTQNALDGDKYVAHGVSTVESQKCQRMMKKGTARTGLTTDLLFGELWSHSEQFKCLCKMYRLPNTFLDKHNNCPKLAIVCYIQRRHFVMNIFRCRGYHDLRWRSLHPHSQSRHGLFFLNSARQLVSTSKSTCQVEQWCLSHKNRINASTKSKKRTRVVNNRGAIDRLSSFDKGFQNLFRFSI